MTLPAVLVGTAAGTLLIAIGFAGSRAHDSWGAWPFWIGWVMSTILLGAAIISPSLSARGRVVVVVIQAGQQSFVRWMYSPLAFTFPDELSHWRTSVDILHFHHLYHSNPRLPVSAVFPGLEEVTTSLVSLTHVGLFTAGTIVAATSHVMLAPAAYYLFRRVSGNARIAGIAVFAFAMNPLHAGFDSMFIYQAPALLLGTVVFETALDEREEERGGWASIALALVCLAGIIVTHHLTAAVFIISLAVVGVLLTILSGFTPKAKRVLGLAVAGVLMATIWVIAEAGAVLSYLGTPLGNTISGLIHFGSNAGTVALPASSQGTSGGWLTVLATAVTAILVLVGGWTVWRRPPEDGGRSVLLRAFALCALAYFAVLGVRAFAPDGAELSGRLLVFTALFTSVVIAVALVSGLPVRQNLRRWVPPLAAVAALLVIFLGAKLSGWPAAWEQLPGTFHAAAFESGIDRQNTLAVRWFGAHVGPDRRVVCDASICALAAAYAEAIPIPNEGQLYYSRHLTPGMIQTLHRRDLDYLFVDRRLSQEAPITGSFFHTTPADSGSQTGPVPAAGLTKFAYVPGIQLIYDNGPIQIYDLRKLAHG